MTGAPGGVDAKQLVELGIRVVAPPPKQEPQKTGG
jgi:hypothetical protein